MKPSEALQVLNTAKQHDRWMLPKDQQDAIDKATEWSICLPQHMTLSDGIAAVRAHYASEQHREPLTTHHLIQWHQQHATNQTTRHNPMALHNTDGTYQAWCPCGNLDVHDLPTVQHANQITNTHQQQATQ